ncbi:hypothetical protein KC318_g11380 [Hortaea werneckii]|nr:hypothetical protein KC334_g1571 [Hortaea werneckii]KAI6975028.1 hypothetical protein KC355_g11445 [Hortaea werneckii]KAI7658193.1 hypothetical protein KC318_g11380 [Hortaea werneckii]
MAFTFPNTSCPKPFLDLNDYPYKAGFERGRFCGAFRADLTCCLACPLEYWSYSDEFSQNVDSAHWVNLPAMVCQIFLLVTFIVLPPEKSHRHYLSVGLCLALILLELGFIVPLAAKPEMCADAITPHDLHSDLSCGWSGALLELGAMAGVIWILLRSLWTHLRVCYDIKHTQNYVWASHIIGWGVPGIFLAISLPVTGVSYRLGTTCIPNQQHSFVTWFGWLIAFGCLAALLQFGTTAFCLFLYARHFWQNGSRETEAYDVSTAGLAAEGQRRPSIRLGKRLAWRRVQKVLFLQWRSIVLSILVIIETVFFGAVYVAAATAVDATRRPTKRPDVLRFLVCLIVNEGDKDACLPFARSLGLGERTVIASFYMSALIGIFTFLVMVRQSMLTGCSGPQDPTSKRSSGGSVRFAETSPFAAIGTLPEPGDSVRRMSMPEAGDVTTRHEGVPASWFDEDVEKEDNRTELRDH